MPFRIINPAVIIVGAPVFLFALSLISYLYSGISTSNKQEFQQLNNINGISRLRNVSPRSTGQDRERTAMASVGGPLPQRSHTLGESVQNSSHIENVPVNRVKSVGKMKAEMVPRVTGGRQRYLIYLCDEAFRRCGGWTDRLKGIVIGYLISKATNRTFGINMSYPKCELTRYLPPNKVAWNLTSSEFKSYNYSVGYYKETSHSQFYNAINDLDFNTYMKEDIVFFQGNLDYVDGFKNNSRYRYENAWFANLTRDQVYAKVFKELFWLAPGIQNELSTFMKIAKPSSKHTLVCSQIRIGKNPTNPMDRAITPPDDVLKVWAFLKNYTNSDKYRIYVTSDSDEILKKAHAYFPDVLVDNGGTIVHIDRFVRGSNTCEGMKKVIYDQQILSKCDVLLLTFSGIGRMSAYFRQRESGLFCLVKHEIVECNLHTVKELYNVKG